MEVGTGILQVARAGKPAVRAGLHVVTLIGKRSTPQFPPPPTPAATTLLSMVALLVSFCSSDR